MVRLRTTGLIICAGLLLSACGSSADAPPGDEVALGGSASSTGGATAAGGSPSVAGGAGGGDGGEGGAAGGVEDVCFGTPYYVHPGYGGQNGPSTGDHARPWTEIAQVNAHSFGTSDCLYFMAGTTLRMTSRLTVSWSGTAAAPAIIGAYHLSGDAPVHGLPPGAANQMPPPPTGGDRPILDGNNEGTTATPERYSYSGLIHIRDQDYVTVRDLDVIGSGGAGVVFAGQHQEMATGGVVRNCRFYRSWRRAIEIARASDCLVEGNRTFESSYGGFFNQTSPCPWPEGLSGGAIMCDGCCVRVMGAAIEITGMEQPFTLDNVARNNVVQRANEGIGIYGKATRTIVEDNIVFDSGTYNIYVSRGIETTIRNNLVYATPDATRWPSRGRGIVISAEMNTYQEQFQLGGNSVHDNYVAGTGRGMHVGISGGENLYGQKDNRIYRNRFIDNTVSFGFSNDTMGNWSGNEIHDNSTWLSFWSENTQVFTKCNPVGFAFRDNFFTCYGTCSASGFPSSLSGHCSDPQATKPSRLNTRVLQRTDVDFRNLPPNGVPWDDKSRPPPWFLYEGEPEG